MKSKTNNTKTFSFKGYRSQALMGPLFKLLEASFELLVPRVVANIIDNGIKCGDTKYIVTRFFLLIFLGLIGLICSVIAQYYSAKVACGYSAKIRQNVYNKIQTFDFSALDAEGTSSLINKITNDTNQIQTGVNLVLRLFMRSPFVVFGAMISAFMIDKQAGIIFVEAIIILSIIVFGIMLVSIPLFKKVQSKNDHIMSLTRENLIGIRVMRAFNQEQNQTKIYEKANSDLTRSQKIVGNISQAINPLTFVTINIFIILLINSGAISVNAGNLNQGDVFALYEYMSMILVELVKLANLIIQVTKAFASKKRIEAIINTANTLIQNDNIKTFDYDKTTPIIKFNNVSMAYNKGKDVLTGINFEVYPGQTIGIIGGTGSGKTSLINLIMHFYDASSGSVEYKGINVNCIDPDVLKNQISVVMQKSAAFSGTIKDNILIGKPDATDEEIIKALKDSQSYEFVFAKKDNINHIVEQDGRNLSGGQKQRLSIARALVKQSEVLILDDSSSALDYKTDMMLRQAINSLNYNPTKIIISQRASSIKDADTIIVLDDGKVVGIGKHSDLINTCDVYREIHNISVEDKDEK